MLLASLLGECDICLSWLKKQSSDGMQLSALPCTLTRMCKMQARAYLNKLPTTIAADDRVLIADPMLATGDTSISHESMLIWCCKSHGHAMTYCYKTGITWTCMNIANSYQK